MATFALQWQSQVAMRKTIEPVQPKVLNIWPFTKRKFADLSSNRKG